MNAAEQDMASVRDQVLIAVAMQRVAIADVGPTDAFLQLGHSLLSATPTALLGLLTAAIHELASQAPA